jgi:hypothetical protein
MRICLDRDNNVHLDEASDFRRFSVVVEQDVARIERVRQALSGIAVLPDSNSAWVSEAALRKWAGLDESADWQEGLTNMIEKARPHGWVDENARAIKVHVEWIVPRLSGG